MYSYISHDIDFLVLCRGVPWGINPTPGSPAPNPPKSFSDAASVDSEISGRFVSSKSFAGFVKNPLFNNYSWAMTPSITGTIPVARLDGVSRADVEASVKNALEAEKKGVRGRVYIDESKREKTGDKWLSAAGKILSAAGFDVSENTEPRLFGFADRMDAPAFYFGWYAFNPAGYFADKNFKFPAGASALHIFSFSAANMRDRNSWTPAFTAEGAGEAEVPTPPPAFDPERYRWLVIPDVALQKARLVRCHLAGRADCWSENSYGFAAERPEGVLGRVCEIERIEPYDPRRLKRAWKGLGAEVLKRDFPFAAEEIMRRLGLHAGADLRVAFTKTGNDFWAIRLK